jgi:hypothetical protein
VLLALVLAVAGIQASPPAQVPTPVKPADSAGAYLDPAARDLVERARERRNSRAGAITAYHAEVKERLSLGLRALRRDRVFYRRELAGRIAWHRDGSDTVVMSGAREAVPVVQSGVQVPEDLEGDAPDLAFDPADDRFVLGRASGDLKGGDTLRRSVDDSGHGRGGHDIVLHHPLAPGGEAHYRYRAGDTTEIALPDGRTLRLLELRVLPRRDDFQLLVGSFWIDGETDEVVRAVFRPARPFDWDRDVSADDRKDADRYIPGFLKPIRGEVRYITVEYALWENHWWMPRLLAFDGVASAGSFLTTPLRYERVYSDYRVQGDTSASATRSRAARAPRRPRRHRRHHASSADTVAVRDTTAADSAGVGDSIIVLLAGDSASLLTSADLPPSIAADGEAMMSVGELRDLAAQLKLLPQAPRQPGAARLNFGLGAAGLVRFNRIEGLSLGARYEFDLGRFPVDATARFGVADHAVNAEVGISRETAETHTRLAGYRRLAAANPATRPLGFGNSLSGILLGRDDGAYFRAAGAELIVTPALTAAQSYTVRLFAERQRGAGKATDVSLPHLLHSDHRFGSNITAVPADEAGVGLTLRAWNSDLQMDAATGTYDFARVALTTRATVRLPKSLLGAVELAAGTSGGEVPPQGRWYLGGPATLRGYGGLAASGEAFWRGRVEVANAFPAARVALFSDVGWAGSRSSFTTGRSLIGAGVGVSFFDGLVRIDLTRRLRAPTGWRMDFYVDGIL